MGSGGAHIVDGIKLYRDTAVTETAAVDDTADLTGISGGADHIFEGTSAGNSFYIGADTKFGGIEILMSSTAKA